MIKGKIESYLEARINENGCIHAVLIDPEKFHKFNARKLIEIIERAGTSAILVGGSTGVTESLMFHTIEIIKEYCKLPVIIFPSGLNSITSNADAIFYMSLLNSQNPYYLIEAQMLAAPIIKRYKLEAIPVGYLIIGEGEAVSYVGWARPIPIKHHNIIAAYAMAAEMLGMRMVYLEAGSGSKTSIPPETVELVRRNVNIHLIVGGGIRDAETAGKLAKAGAEIVVTGSLIEEINDYDELYKILRKINENIRVKS